MNMPGYTAGASLYNTTGLYHAVSQAELFRSGKVYPAQLFAGPVQGAWPTMSLPKPLWHGEVFEPFCTKHFIYVTDWETKTVRKLCYKKCADGVSRPCGSER